MTQDEMLDVVVELEDITRRLYQLRRALSKSIGDPVRLSPEAKERILRAVFPAAQHQFAPPHQGMMCCDVGVDEVEL